MSSPPMSSPIRLAINGYGRIGRCLLRAWQESALRPHFDVVAIVEPSDLDSIVYLTQYDSTHGPFPATVEQGDAGLVIEHQHIRVLQADAPESVDWAALGVDIVLECSGRYTRRADLRRFLDAGAPRLLLSNPGASAEDVDATIVHGINHDTLREGNTIVSSASCTTNAVVPVLHALDQAYGINQAFLTTLHSVMNDQPLIDGYHHHDLRRTRSAMQSIVPVATGLAQGVERILPTLAGRVQAKSIRVPIVNVSAIDIMVNLGRGVDCEALNALFRQLARHRPGLIAYTDRPHASIDFNHNPHSAIVDASQTRSHGNGFANLLIWFDNEWGFVNRMLDVALAWSRIFNSQ